MKEKEVLRLMQQIDNGYLLTENEQRTLLEQKRLDVSRMLLTKLPESMSSLANLTELNLSNNQLTSLPEWIGNLTSLTRLYLQGNQLTSLPESMGKLTGLTELYLSGDLLTSLPEWIGNLTSLTRLYFPDWHLTSLPEWMVNLTGLTELYLLDCHLTSLPEWMGGFTSLTILNLSSNQLTSLPESMVNLTGLTKLYLRNNQLTSLPESISGLIGLTELNLSSNQLTNLPEWIGNLTSLTKLYLQGNQLTSLPEWIGNLTGLTELNLSNNQLTSLPESIGNLTGLTKLYLQGNHLTSLPESIGKLTGLTKLNLSSNHLTSLPESIGNLTGLTELNLWSNQLTSLPESMGDLTGLTKLNLSSNHLTSLPESIGNLTGLTMLYLPKNYLTSLPKSMGNLFGLTELNLSNTKLASLPEWICKLESINTLLLRDLTLDCLPETLLDLKLHFSCGGKKLAFRDEKTGMKKMGGIFLNNTTLSLQPVSIFDQSDDTSPNRSASRKLIQDYFQAKHIPLRESKVILLGDAAAGKTYTVQRLLNGCQKGDYSTETTHGILIEDLHPKKDGEEYTVRIWDFGGQDIMNEMHRCFLTDRTCYVILVDTRNNGQTQRARRWLRTVHSVAPKAPVILLVNEMTGGVNLDLDAISLKKEFPNLKQVRHCSAKEAELDEFRRKVEKPILDCALRMDSCKMTLPESWEQVRQKLLAMRENNYYIDRDEFHQLCDEHNIPKDNQLRVWLLNWFNDMGVCFSYHFEGGRERETDYKILEPKWLTSAIYRLIWGKEQNEHGIITRKEIEYILKQAGSKEEIQKGVPCLPGVSYQPEECEYVLEIMRKFCISYPVNEWEEFMPTLCKPDSKLDPAPKEYVQQVSVQFRYDLLPEKVIHELMIYCYQYLSRGRMWRKGFWLENKEQGLCAVIYATEEKNTTDTLQMDVYAIDKYHDAAQWLQPLCMKIRELNSRSNLKAEEWVHARGESEEKWFKLDVVWNWWKKNREKLMGDDTEFPIQPLLALVYGRWLSTAEQEHGLLKTKQDDFSSEKEEKLENLVPDILEALNSINDALNRNTEATTINTVSVDENTDALAQSKGLLELIRDGKYDPPKYMTDELVKIIQSQQSLREKFDASQKTSLLDRIRSLMADSASFVTLYMAFAPYLPDLIDKLPKM